MAQRQHRGVDGPAPLQNRFTDCGLHCAELGPYAMHTKGIVYRETLTIPTTRCQGEGARADTTLK